MLEHMLENFDSIFEENEDKVKRAFMSPGRVNLIGEHTDYNGGYVFPCALSVGTYLVIRERDDLVIRFYSDNFSDLGIIETQLDDLAYKKEHDWANYPKGVLVKFTEDGFTGGSGFDAYFSGNIPNGAGLSSSASIELAMAIAWDTLNQFNVQRIPMVQLCQRAENEYVGVNCGIMDQFAIGMGKKDQAIMLDCNTLEYSYAPVKLKGVKLVLANTNKRRGLADSNYNIRRIECETALFDLQKKLSVTHLCEIKPVQFEEHAHLVEGENERKRAKHVIYENARTIEAHKHLETGDIEAFGRLMNESHRSLRDDYEVTGDELDALAEAAWAEPNVIGARMTGAGFGGCTVNLIKEDQLEEVLERIAERYKKQTGIATDFYIVEIGEGTKELHI